VTVDVVDASGNGLADRVAADLRAGGLVIGEVTSGPGPATSAIEYPEGGRPDAERLADAVGVARYLRQAAVTHLTVVLGPDDHARLVTALDRLAECAPSSTPPSTTPSDTTTPAATSTAATSTSGAGRTIG
jgi:hypothetical protein